MPGAGSAEPNRNTTMMPKVKISFLRRSGVLNAWANLITVATAPLMPQSRRPFRPPVLCSGDLGAKQVQLLEYRGVG